MDMKQKQIDKKTKRMYVTHVSKYLRYNYTKPCVSIKKSLIAAENMICSAIMKEEKIDWAGKTHFSSKLRRDYPEFIVDAQQYIGETIEVEVPMDMTPRVYRAWFCTVSCNDDLFEESD